MNRKTVEWVLAVLAVVVLFVIYWNVTSYLGVYDSQPKPATIEQLRDELRPLKEEIKELKERQKDLETTTTPPPWAKGTLVRINRINRYLAGSPMQGLGYKYNQVAVKYGLNVYLLPAINYHESHLGRIIPKGSFNGGGIIAGKGQAHVMGRGADGNRPYRRFSSWGEFIEAQGALVYRHWGSVDSPYQMPGYAVSPAWKPAVASEVERVKRS